MHRAVRRLAAAVLLTPLAGVVSPPTLAAQIVRGPTYTSRAWAPFTLTAWTRPVGYDAAGAALYAHWFTGTMRFPAMASFGSTFYAGARETFDLSPWASGDESAPPNPYTGCDCFTYAVAGVATYGYVVTINTRWTMGIIPTTIPDFIVPVHQTGGWGYTEYLNDGRLIDRDNFGEFSDFFVTADAPAPDPNITPEPATLVLLGTGLAAVGLARRRRERTA